MSSLIERLEAAHAELDRASAIEWSRRGDVHWIDTPEVGDSGVDLCHSCAMAQADRLRKKHPSIEVFVGRACGAYEAEHSCACDHCGKPLSYSLLRYGIISEVEHFLENPLTQDEGPGVIYEVERILSGARYLKWEQDGDLIEDALRIGETAVQLLGYRDELARLADDGGPAAYPQSVPQENHDG